MKKIEAIIRSSKFEEVKEALAVAGINFFTFYEVKGYGHQKGKEMSYRGAVYDVGYIGRIKLEILISEDFLQIARDTVSSAAHTGEHGDGLILVSTVEDIINIRSKLGGAQSINL